jgi:hypothetical protein
MRERGCLGTENSPHHSHDDDSQEPDCPTKGYYPKIYRKQSEYACFVGIKPAQMQLLRIFQAVLVVDGILGSIKILRTSLQITTVDVIQLLCAAEPRIPAETNEPKHRQDYADTHHTCARHLTRIDPPSTHRTEEE